MQLADVANVVTVVGAPLTFISVLFAIKQIRQARTATEASNIATKRATSGMIQHQVLLAIPEVQRVNQDLEFYIDNANPARVIELLNH